ncbi:hypothetical protein RAHE111665_17145 [Rariglobus hedericola]
MGREADLGGERGGEGGFGGDERFEINGAQAGEIGEPFLRRGLPSFIGGVARFDVPRAEDGKTHADAGEAGEMRGVGSGGFVGDGIGREGAEPAGEFVFEGGGGGGRGGDGGGHGFGDDGRITGIAAIAGAGFDVVNPGEAGGVAVFAAGGGRARATRRPIAARQEERERVAVVVGQLCFDEVIGFGPDVGDGALLEEFAAALTGGGVKRLQPHGHRGERLGRADAAHVRRSGTDGHQ